MIKTKENRRRKGRTKGVFGRLWWMTYLGMVMITRNHCIIIIIRVQRRRTLGVESGVQKL